MECSFNIVSLTLSIKKNFFNVTASLEFDRYTDMHVCSHQFMETANFTDTDIPNIPHTKTDS